MDANRQKFWMVADRRDWVSFSATEYDQECRRLRLRDRRPDRAPAGAVSQPTAELAVNTPRRAVDAFGTVAFWNPTIRSVMATGAIEENGRMTGEWRAGVSYRRSDRVLFGSEVYRSLRDDNLNHEPGSDEAFWRLTGLTLWAAPAGVDVADLAMGFDDVLYVALHDAGGTASIGLFDPRGRWRNPPVVQVPTPGFTPHRLTADPAGGVLALDRTLRQVGRVRGYPLRDGLPPEFADMTFRPDPENANPPRFEAPEAQPQPQWSNASEAPVDLFAHSSGRAGLISWTPQPESPTRPERRTWLHLRDASGTWTPPVRLIDAGQAVGARWYSESRIVLLPASRVVNGQRRQPREALAFDPGDPGGDLVPAGGFYPVRNLADPAFLNGVTLPPQYRNVQGRVVPLRAVSVASYECHGVAISRVLDSRTHQTAWHRIYLEAIIPLACGASVELAASDDPAFRPAESEWHRHLFGGNTPDQRPETAPLPWLSAAKGVWLRDRSEIPHHPGLLEGWHEERTAGLFTALVQRPGRHVRELRGQYLHVRLRLFGAGHVTPEIAAVRVYGSRFSYRDDYLPELYREELFGPGADATGRATGADFLERFLLLFESVLTPLEDRVATAQVLMDPRSAPDSALDWLASWIGVVFDPLFPPDRRRAWLEAAPRLSRTHGTLAGLQLALEIVTGGRLRRGFVRSQGADRAPVEVSAIAAGTEFREQEFPSGGGVTRGQVLVIENFRLRKTFSTLLGVNLSLGDDPLLPGLIVSANSRVGDTLFLGENERVELLALFRDAFSAVPEIREGEKAAVRAFFAELAYRVTIFVHDEVDPVDFGMVRRVAERQGPAHVEIQVVRATMPLLVGLASLVDVDTFLGPGRVPVQARLDSTFIGEGDYIRMLPALDARIHGGRGAVRRLPVARINAPAIAEPGENITLDGSASTAPPGRELQRYTWTQLRSNL
jgi:phage tail-like protein